MSENNESPSAHFTVTVTREQIDEYMWGGYLKFLLEEGVITEDTSEEEIWKLKKEFKEDLSNGKD